MQHLSLHSCSAPALSVCANTRHMGQVDEDRTLVKGLVEWSGLSVRRFALKIGVSPSTINRHFNGTATTRLGRDTLAKLREHFPDYPSFAKRNNSVRSEVAQFGDRPFDEKFGAAELPAIPVVGSAIAMSSFDPERDIELTELDMGDVLDNVRRPVSLAHDKTAYAVTVIGDSMWPRFRPGRRIIVSPREPVSIGDDVVVQLRGNQGDEEHRERVAVVLIKELVRRSASYIELRQFNPDETFRVEVGRVAAIHKVIGEVY